MSVSSSSETEEQLHDCKKVIPCHNSENRYFSYVCVINNFISYDLHSEHFCK